MLRAQAHRFAVVISAYRPTGLSVDAVCALAGKSFSPIVVVDDGSGPDFRDTFARLAAIPGVEVLHHAANLGKGAALKTGINHALAANPDLAGVITADAAGRYEPDDIERIGESLLAHPGSLVLGCRRRRGAIPLTRRIANFANRALLRALTGRPMSDSQTGLRGIPSALALRLLRLEANGDEFELEMLVAARRWGAGLVEEAVRSAQPASPSTVFCPLADSMKLYFLLLRFGCLSLATALTDNLVFILARRLGCPAPVALALGRVVALAFNYPMARRLVFRSHRPHKAVLPKYLLLWLASGMATYGGIRLLTSRLGMDALPAKLSMETLLFLANFAVERLFIFKPEEPAPARAAAPRPVRTLPAGLISAVVLVIFLAALAVEAYGFRTANLFSQSVWDPIGVKRFLRYMGMYLGLAVPLLVVTRPNRKCSPPCWGRACGSS
jgi:putative flippase GtrA